MRFTRDTWFLLTIVLFGLSSCGEKMEQIVLISTPYGDMKAVLFDETPIHKENFLKLVEEGKYDSVIFHRVIENFMIQGGNLGTGKWGKSENYLLDAEFRGERIHEKGAIAAARRGDSSNPLKKSSGTQFYIVQGEKYDSAGLQVRARRREFLKLNGLFDQLRKMDRYNELNEKYNYHAQKAREDSTYNWGEALEELVFNSKDLIDKEFGPQVDPGFSAFQRMKYAEVGGAPHLDGEYTVFGQVIEGLEVIDKIAAVETDRRDKPNKDIRMYMSILEIPASELSSKYGIESNN